MSFVSLVIALMLQAPADPPKQDPPKQDPPKGFVITSGDWSLKFYGFLRADMFYDTQHPNNVLVPAAIKANESDATAAAFPGVAARKGSEDFEISPRLTRFGFDITGPMIERLGAKASGKIELDFYSTNVVSDSRAEFRMRHAYAKLAWDDVYILAGQTSDVISPIFPSVNSDLVMWGAGNLGDRRPQFQFGFTPKVGEGQVSAQLEIGVTGANDNQNLDAAGVSYLDGVSSGLPTIQGRLGYKGPHFWLKEKKFEIGGWAHYAQEKFDQVVPFGAFTEDKFVSMAYGFDVTLPLFDMLEIKGEAWSGKNLDDVRGGIFQGVTSFNGGTEIKSRGYWIEITLKPVEWYSFGVGASADNPMNEAIAAPGAGTTAPTGALANHILYVANRFMLGNGLTVGFDVLHWTTTWGGGLEDGVDNRINMFIQWNF